MAKDFMTRGSVRGAIVLGIVCTTLAAGQAVAQDRSL